MISSEEAAHTIMIEHHLGKFVQSVIVSVSSAEPKIFLPRKLVL